MGRCRSRYVVFVAVILLNLLHLGSSQSINGPRRRFENAPSGLSADAEEEQQRASERQKVSVSGTATSLMEAEGRKKSNNTGFEEVDIDLRDSDDSPGPAYVESDVDLAKIDNDPDPPHFVNGHTGGSVHNQEIHSAGNRKVIPTDAKAGKKTQLRKGLHIYTTDWSRDSSQWSFKGGEWSLVTLPDAENHPGLPAPPVPGPALVVVTENSLSKVYASRDLEQLENVTLHYSYYLSEGEPPHGVPELDVYQVKDDQTRLVSSESTHGDWSESTISLPFSGSSKIVFVGRLNKKGNEIAIDDITIRGYSGTSSEAAIKEKKIENDTSKNSEEENPSMTRKANTSSDTDGETKLDESDPSITDIQNTPRNSVTEGETPQESSFASEKEEEAAGKSTMSEKSDKSEQGTTKSMIPDLSTSSSNLAQGNDTYTLSGNNTGIGDGSNSNNSLSSADKVQRLNETFLPVTTDSAIETDKTLNEADELIHDYESNSGNETNENLEEVPETNSSSTDSTEVPQTNLTNLSYFTTDDVKVAGEENDTDVSEVTNFNSLVTDSVSNDNDDDTDTNNYSPNATLTSETLDKETSAPSNETGPEVTTNPSNLTGYILGNNSTGEVNVTVSSSVTAILATVGPHNASSATTQSNKTDSEVTTNPSNITGYILGNNSTGEVNVTVSSNVTAILATVGPHNSSSATTQPNKTVSEVTTNSSNITGYVGNNSTGGFPIASSTTAPFNETGPEVTTNSSNLTGYIGSINASSGVTTNKENVTIATAGGAEGSSSSSWSVFKIFLIIGLLGVTVMGFLYWRRQRRRDDEVPVFSRTSQADYLNPSFSDDDSNFASRGTSHNYKSFN
ncbi:dentin sialophosphoprotein-like isoform X2 [Macrobrachium nipponense]|uniref:dentin sialophosphoprotein-like isoform X2 n=1 Tax=Macrobrachium nipponense TaxID=159736 RepID=UPI0030C85949